ncbi:MAG: LTA synthase family protein [Pseudomonadales bacterium]
MSKLLRSEPLLGVLWRQLLLVITLGTLVRAVLVWVFSAAQPTSSQAVIFLSGLGHDLLVAGVAGTGILLAAAWGRRPLLASLVLIAFVFLLVSVAEVFFWNEFQSRPDRLVFHYLSYPQEVLTFLEDQFYLSLYIVPFLLLVLLVHWWLRPPPVAAITPTRKAFIGLILCFTFGILLCSVPLPIGRVPAQLVSNGYVGVLRAALTDESRWHDLYLEADASSQLPEFVPQNVWQQPPQHLLLIIEESFAGPTWQNPEQRARYLPNFIELVNRSWSFNNVFATGSRTTRGMEALLNGVPPLPGVSTTQRRGPERLPSLPRALSNAGWHTAFVYAGWPNFSDLSRYWRAIGFEDTTSRNDFTPTPERFETSWGYADETLFERLLLEMDQRIEHHDNVFIAALTVSHHRPFDYPAGRVPFPADERRSEFAMAYADWALGTFLTQASKRSWYDDTLFVVAGDHGARFFGNASIPVNAYRVPLIFYAPGRTQRQELDHLGSLMEVPGTLLDLLQVADSEGFYGTHLLDPTRSLVPVEHDYDVGLVDETGVTVLKRGRNTEHWQWRSSGARKQLQPGPVSNAHANIAALLFQQAFERYFGSGTSDD